MKILRLGGGPTLMLYSDWDTEPADVTERAHQYLWENVAVQSSFKVGDIFRLLRACPPLIDIFARWHVKEFLANAEQGGKEWPAEAPLHERIESFELTSGWHADAKTGRIEYNQKMNLCGIGYAQQVDNEIDGTPAGHRTIFDVSGSVMHCLDAPLRVNKEFEFYYYDFGAKKKFKPPVIDRDGVTLGEILEGFFYGISWFGGPGDQEAFAKMLKEADDDEASWSGPFNADQISLYMEETLQNVNDPLGRACKAIFKKRGSFDNHVLDRVVWQLDDEANAQASLTQSFKGKVRLKRKFCDMNGRQLREAYVKILRENSIAIPN